MIDPVTESNGFTLKVTPGKPVCNKPGLKHET